MPEPRVHCSYDGVCIRRSGVDRLVPYVGTQYCEVCDHYFCAVHRHLNPTARPSQYCEDHSVFHPVCWDMTVCEVCGAQTCFVGHVHLVRDATGILRCHSRTPDRWNGRTREVMLTFAGEPGSHAMAQGNRFIGLEIEVENGGHFELPREFGIVSDGSLDSSGVEILTPPSRGDALVTNVNLAMDTLSRAGYEGTPSCGLHTHIDLRDKKSDQRFLSRLFAIGFAVEDMLYTLQERDRHTGHYAIPLRKEYPFYCAKGPFSPNFEYIYNKLDKGRYGARHELNELRKTKWGNRYLGFNFHSVFHRGTMEVRIHEGTLDPDRILHWADLLQSLIARAETKISYRELLAIMNTKTKGVKIERMQRAFDLTDKTTSYLETFTRPKVIEIPFGLDSVPRRE